MKSETDAKIAANVLLLLVVIHIVVDFLYS